MSPGPTRSPNDPKPLTLLERLPAKAAKALENQPRGVMPLEPHVADAIAMEVLESGLDNAGATYMAERLRRKLDPRYPMPDQPPLDDYSYRIVCRRIDDALARINRPAA